MIMVAIPRNAGMSSNTIQDFHGDFFFRLLDGDIFERGLFFNNLLVHEPISN